MPLGHSQTKFWVIALAIFALLLWVLNPVLLPFVAAMAIAYFLNPVVNLIGRLAKLPRWAGALVALVLFITLVVVILLLLVPVVQSQISGLIDSLPTYIEEARARLLPWAKGLLKQLPANEVEKLKDAAGTYAGSVVGWSGSFLKSLITSGMAVFNVITLVVITPVVAFYLLRDWPRVISAVDSLLPRKHHAVIHEQLRLIDHTLSGFLRGQALVCLCLGLIYGTGLSLIGLKFGATIGIVAGFLSFIPYVGSTFGLVCSMALAFIQFTDPSQILMTLAVFLTGQTLEGYFLTPKLVGDRVGLHPVWILFALFAGGSLLGFVGVLIAVPTAAVIGVLIRFALKNYRNSSLYHHETTAKAKE